MLYRECIRCRELFGCIKNGKLYRCSSCSDKDDCLYTKANGGTYSRNKITGGICDFCWVSYRESHNVAEQI